MRWEILSKNEAKDSAGIVSTLVKNRGIKDVKEFLDPNPPEKIDLDFSAAIKLINKKIKQNKKIVVYGDYDADGICSTAIMWEALKNAGANVLPFIPSREKEGYGLSEEGIDQIDADLIIAVDNGIVAHDAVAYAMKKGLAVIVVDHHEKPKTLPKASVIVHTTKLCAAGICYFLAKELGSDLLDLTAIATVTDIMPLTGINRSIVKFGLEALNKTKRPGLKAIFEMAGIKKVGVYEIGFMIGPRLNASGRIDSALTALRLLCTHNKDQANQLAHQLNEVNKERQLLTSQMADHAKENVRKRLLAEDRIIIAQDEGYHQGIIGLIAGKLTEEYYLPAIVIARSETVSKASARSISGFNIIEAIRRFDSLLINSGGHPMAAGFSIETAKIEAFISTISAYAQKNMPEEILQRTLRVDMNLPLEMVSFNLYETLSRLAPFGMGNPEPVFAATGEVEAVRAIGQENKHLKLKINDLDAVAFNQGYLFSKLKVGQEISLAYSISLDTFNGNQKLQLKVRDLHLD